MSPESEILKEAATAMKLLKTGPDKKDKFWTSFHRLLTEISVYTVTLTDDPKPPEFLNPSELQGVLCMHN